MYTCTPCAFPSKIRACAIPQHPPLLKIYDTDQIHFISALYFSPRAPPGENNHPPSKQSLQYFNNAASPMGAHTYLDSVYTPMCWLWRVYILEVTPWILFQFNLRVCVFGFAKVATKFGMGLHFEMTICWGDPIKVSEKYLLVRDIDYNNYFTIKYCVPIINL